MSGSHDVEACRQRSWILSILGALALGLIVWWLLGWSFWIALILGIVAYFLLSWLMGRSCDKAEAAAKAEAEARAQAQAAEKAKADALARAEAEAAAKSVAAAAAAAKAEADEAPKSAVATDDAAPADADHDDAGVDHQDAPGESADASAGQLDQPSDAGHASAGGGHWSGNVATDSGKASGARGQSPLKASAALAEEETLRANVGSWRYGADPAQATAETEAAAAPAAKAATDGGAESQPATLSGAREGGADDLKRIKGVGPGLEKTLNELGFYHFDQIAAWTSAEIEWVDARLKFKGRITRDDWVGQAAAFAKGD